MERVELDCRSHDQPADFLHRRTQIVESPEVAHLKIGGLVVQFEMVIPFGAAAPTHLDPDRTPTTMGAKSAQA